MGSVGVTTQRAGPWGSVGSLHIGHVYRVRWGLLHIGGAIGSGGGHYT